MGAIMNRVRAGFKKLEKDYYFGVIRDALQGESSTSTVGHPSWSIVKAWNHDYSVYVPETNAPRDSNYISIDISKRNLQPYNHNDPAHQALYYRALENHPAFFKSDHISASRGAKKGLTLPMTDAVKKHLGLVGGGKSDTPCQTARHNVDRARKRGTSKNVANAHLRLARMCRYNNTTNAGFGGLSYVTARNSVYNAHQRGNPENIAAADKRLTDLFLGGSRRSTRRKRVTRRR